MNMKLQALAVSAVMLFTAACPAAMAETDSKMEEILVSVKDRVDVPEECSEFRSDVDKYETRTEYHFSWDTPDDAQEHKSMMVTCTDSGVITNYYYYNYDSKTARWNNDAAFPDFDREEVKRRAQDFADKLNPQLKGKIIVEDNSLNSLYSTDCNFFITRMENGIPVLGDSGHINFNDGNKYVSSFFMTWTDVQDIPPVDDAISLADAQSAFAEKLGMELVYDSYIDYQEKNPNSGSIVIYPKYIEKESGKYIHALTGEAYERNENYEFGMYSRNTVADSEQAVAAGSSSSAKAVLTSGEIIELDKISGLKSTEDIEKSVRANKLLNIPSDAKLDNVSLRGSRYNKNEYTYSMRFSTDDQNIYVNTDASDGEIRSFSNFSNKDAMTEYDKEETDSIVKQLSPSKFEEFEYTENGNYIRMKNGIKVICNTANVSLNADGTLRYYSMNYTKDVTFPSIDKVISAKEAASALFDVAKYEKKYMINVEEKNITAVPVYILDSSYSINPFNGGAIDYRNEEIEQSKPIKYTDIENHYAKNQIEKLAEFNIGFTDEEFRPDEKITQADFISLLSAVFGRHEMPLARDYAYSSAADLNILKEGERDDEAQVTREMAAVFIIRAVGADKYAEYEDIYVTPFNDVEENKGYIALLSAMGVVEGDDDGNFNPKNSLSRAEAAVMIYNYLNK